MIIASVRFPLPEGTSLEDARKLYEQNLSAYENAPGLITKYYVFGGGKGGGIYLWESREAAERFYTPEWREMIAKKYKGAGDIEWLENPVIARSAARKQSRGEDCTRWAFAPGLLRFARNDVTPRALPPPPSSRMRRSRRPSPSSAQCRRGRSRGSACDADRCRISPRRRRDRESPELRD
jgi:hypothetical protein